MGLGQGAQRLLTMKSWVPCTYLRLNIYKFFPVTQWQKFIACSTQALHLRWFPVHTAQFQNPNVCSWVSLKEMQINKFIMNCLPCLGGILYSLSNTFFDILQLWSCFTKWYQRKQSIELHIKTKMYTNFQECAVWAVNHLPLAQLYKTDIFYKEIHSVDIYLIFWNHIVAIISNISLINLC